VKFTLNDDDDDDDLDIDVGHMTTSQKIGLGALILGGVLVSRGKIKPSTMMRIIKIGGGMAFKAGLLGLVQQGGHAPGEDASKPPRIQGRPGSLLPAGPADPNTADPVKYASKSIVLGAYAAVIKANLAGHISDGRALELAELGARLLGPKGRVGGTFTPDALAVLAGQIPAGGIVPELAILFDILRKLKVVGGGSGPPANPDPLQGGARPVFGGLGDVMQANPKGITSNIRRAAKEQEQGPGRALVAQTADP